MVSLYTAVEWLSELIRLRLHLSSLGCSCTGVLEGADYPLPDRTGLAYRPLEKVFDVYPPLLAHPLARYLVLTRDRGLSEMRDRRRRLRERGRIDIWLCDSMTDGSYRRRRWRG